MIKYILVPWPDNQKFQELPEYEDECFEHESGAITFVPEDLYKKIMYKLEFPKKYENTNLGTIVCYETRAVVNGEDTYWYDLNLLKRGSEVLFYKHDNSEWVISKCVACSAEFPPIFEDSSLLVGINCEIIGVKEESIQNKD